MTRLTAVGVDLSLTGTGLARVSGWNGHELRASTALMGSDAAGETVTARADRLTDLAARIVNYCHGADLVCIERPAYSSNTGSATDRAGLWWLVVARLHRGLGIPVADVVNNHLKMYATGSGAAKKDAVLAETVRRYRKLTPRIADNNEADALQLAALGFHRLTGHAIVELPQQHTRAVTAVKWPPIPTRGEQHG